MALESATYISDLNSSNPAASDAISTADDHLRLIKATLLATFPNIEGAVTKTEAEINDLASNTDLTALEDALDAAVVDVETALALKADKATTITAGSGLSGGGDLSASRTLSIAAGGVGSTELASEAVSNSKVTDSAITTSKLNDASVTAAKLSGAQTGSAPVFGARAWVTFNGTGSNGTNQTILSSGNVSSVYKNGLGDFTINFSTALPSANFAAASMVKDRNGYKMFSYINSQSTSSIRIMTFTTAGGVYDSEFVSLVVVG